MLLDLNLPTLIARLFIIFISFPIHELAHAWVADRLGDNTPRMDGRLTLNPLHHIDPMGALLLLFGGLGWAKPVQINPYTLQRRSRAALMWVALAGPFSNLLLAALGAFPFRLGLVSVFEADLPSTGALPSLDLLLINFVFVNLSLALFNLIPLAPLDGEKIADYLFPPPWLRVLETIRPYGPMVFLAFFFLLPALGVNVFDFILGTPTWYLLRLLIGL